MPRHTDSDAVERWQQCFRRFSHSGLRVAAFCARERIAPATFYAWKRRLKASANGDASAPPNLVPVRVVSQPADAPIELLLPSGCVLRLSPGWDPASVRQLLDLLGVPPC